MSARWRQKNYVEYVREHFGLDDPGHGGKATFDPTAAGYRAYPREHRAVAPPAPEIRLSADPRFRGDAGLTNPEQLLMMAASSCLLLSFHALAAQRGIDVLGYVDEAPRGHDRG